MGARRPFAKRNLFRSGPQRLPNGLSAFVAACQKPPSQPSPKGGKEEFRLGVTRHAVT